MRKPTTEVDDEPVRPGPVDQHLDVETRFDLPGLPVLAAVGEVGIEMGGR